MKRFNTIAIITALIISMQGTAVFAENTVDEANPSTAEEIIEVIDNAADEDTEETAEKTEESAQSGEAADKEAIKAEKEAIKKAGKEAERAEKDAKKADKEAEKDAERAEKDADKKEKEEMKEAVNAAKDAAKSKLDDLKRRFKATRRGQRRQILDEIAAAKREIDDDTIDIFVKNGALDFSKYDNVLPEIENDRTLVPIRAVIEAFNADILWESATSTITITSGDIVIKMQPGNSIININGVETELECAPKLVRDRTLVPIRIIAEALHMNVEWDEDSKTIIIDDADEPDETDIQADADEPNDTDTPDDIDTPEDADMIDDADAPEDADMIDDADAPEDADMIDDADAPEEADIPGDTAGENDTAAEE